MAQDIKLMVKTRTLSGSADARRLRRDGILPGVVYYRDTRSRMIQMDRHAFEIMLHHHASENLIMDLVVDDGNAEKVLMKEVQHQALTDHVIHVDFAEVSMTEKMRVRISIELVGESKGVVAGGVLERILRDIEVECLPGDLVEQFEVDVSGLEIGQHLTVADMGIPDAFTLITAGDVAVAAVAAPRVEEEATPAEEGEAGAAEPEVIGEKKEEGKGEASDKKE